MDQLKQADWEALSRIHDINFEMLTEFDRICKKHNITYYFWGGALLGTLRHKDFIPWDNDLDFLMTRAEFDRLLPILREELDPEIYEIVMPGDYGKNHYFDMVPRINYKKCEICAFSEDYNAYYKGKTNRIAIDFFFLDRIPETIGGEWTVTRLKLLYGLLNAYRFSGSLGMPDKKGLIKVAEKVLRVAGKLFSMEKMCKKVEALARKYEGCTDLPVYRVTNDTMKSFTFHYPVEDFETLVPAVFRGKEFLIPGGADRIMTIMYGDYMTLPPEEERIPHMYNHLVTADLFKFDE